MSFGDVTFYLFGFVAGVAFLSFFDRRENKVIRNAFAVGGLFIAVFGAAHFNHGPTHPNEATGQTWPVYDIGRHGDKTDHYVTRLVWIEWLSCIIAGIAIGVLGWKYFQPKEE